MNDRPFEIPSASTDASRRGFMLAAAAGLAGASSLLSACANSDSSSTIASGPAPRAKSRTPLRDNEPMRMAVIGTGGMGTGHCDAFMSLTKQGKMNAQIVAVADVCDSHLNNAAKKCRDGQSGVEVQATRDYREILARNDIHAVLIASPEHWHEKHATDALLAGKDVYLEKPMTLRLDEALRLRKIVLANPDLRLQVGTQMTNLPKYHAARQMIADGMIGKVVSSQTSYCRNSKDGEWNYYGLDPNWKPGVNLDWDAWCGPLGPAKWDPLVYARWRRYKKYSTGILGDLLVHVMTPMLVAIEPGWPTRVVASGGHYVDKAMENHDQVNINIEFETGQTMILTGSTCNEVGLETMIRGHKGNIYLGGRNCVMRPERIYVDEIDEETVECPDIGNDQDLHRIKFVDVVRTRIQPDSDIEQGTKVMVMVDLATRSMWEGGAFAFDPRTMTARRA
jgi:predicted dehydrogenase